MVRGMRVIFGSTSTGAKVFAEFYENTRINFSATLDADSP